MVDSLLNINSAVTRGKKFATKRIPVDTVNDVMFLENSFDGSSPTLLTITEVAELLKVSSTTVRRLQQQQKITHVRVGGCIRFFKEDVIGYLVKQRVKTTN